MNKHAHRLVFDHHRGMCVPAHEHVRSAGKAASGQSSAVVLGSALLLALASSSSMAQLGSRADGAATGGASRSSASAAALAPAARSVSSLVQDALKEGGRSNLPTYTLGGNWELNKGAYQDPSLSPDGKVMTLLQDGKTIVLNWDSFDIGQGYEVRFVQPAGGRALNRVHNLNPSLIDGTLKANSQVLFENAAGIIFGSNSRVNVGSMVATALRISDDVFEKGIDTFRKGEAVLGGDNANVNGFVSVQKGAQIKSLADGKVIMVAPRVVNEGQIETPGGQAILAAGKTAYFYAPLDLSQQGLLVAMDNFDDITLADVDAKVNEAISSGALSEAERPAALGTVENAAGAKVLADKGTINLVGAAIRQKGQLTATTAVKGQNGGIFLSAMKDTANQVLENGKASPRVARNTGTIELAAGSITEVLPSTEGLVNMDGSALASDHMGVRPDELLRVMDKPVEPEAIASTATQQEKDAYAAAKSRYEADLKAYENVLQQASDTFYRSRIDLVGKDVVLRSGSLVQAPGGEVNVVATADWQKFYSAGAGQGLSNRDGSRLVMESGARLDVSGLDNLRLPASRNQLRGRVFSIELADSPVQRDGVIYRSELFADARRQVSIANVTGLYNDIRYSAAEYSTAGGVARLLSQDALVLDKDAELDFSGGKVTYDSGQLISSTLIRDGAVTRIEDARADVSYDQLVSDPSQSDINERLRLGLANTTQSTTNLPEQVVGMSAGAAAISAPIMDVRAKLKADVSMSEVQRVSSQVAEIDSSITGSLLSPFSAIGDAQRVVNRPALLSTQPHLFASLRPSAGLLALGRNGAEDTATQVSQSTDLSELRVVGGGVGDALLGASWTDGSWQRWLDQAQSGLTISQELLQSAGLGGLKLQADRIHLGVVPQEGSAADLVTLQLASGGELDAVARAGLTVHASVKSEGGSIRLATQAADADVRVSAASTLDASGTVRDERLQKGPTNQGVAMAAGSVSVTAGRSAVLEEGSTLDVSGGTWRTSSGALSQGKAGQVSLTVNRQPEQTTGELTLHASSLHGFDASTGATLSLSGLASVALGQEAADKGFTVDSNLYADRGIGKLTVSSLGDIVVADSAVVAPRLMNKVASTGRLGSGSALFDLVELPEGRRNPFNLTLAAKSKGGGYSDVLIGSKALVDTGAGGSIQISAEGSIEMAGTLKAQGGKVGLGLSGGRGAAATNTTEFESSGYIKGQKIHLKADSLIDVSGVSRKYGVGSGQSTQVGEVLAGGTITLGGNEGTAVRGQLLMDDTARMNLSGVSDVLSPTASRAARRVSAAAGTLNIMNTDGFKLLGQVDAKAPDATVAGGTLNVVLSMEGQVDRVAAGAPDYPADELAGPRSIRITQTGEQAKALALDGLKFGQGVMAAALLNQSGFDRVNLRADESIQLNAGVNIQAGEDRSRLQSVTLNASVVDVTDGLTHAIEAHHVAIGPQARPVDGLPLALPQVKAASERAKNGELGGSGTLSVHAGLIEVSGDTAVLGVNTLNLLATLSPDASSTSDRTNGEIRFIGQTAGSTALKGQLSFTGELNLQAGQVYATTLSNARIEGFKTSSLTLLPPAAGSTSQTPLSALGSLGMKADTITLSGSVHQPMGSIDVQANALTVTDTARLSVSADGTQVPVGGTINQTTWVYGTQGVVDASGNPLDLSPANTASVADITALPINKQINLNGKTLKLGAQSVVDASAGGDILAREFKQGAGGSTDTYLRAGLFAVLPDYSYDFAPHDTEMRATSAKQGLDLKAGDQVTITSDNGVLPAGTYTLMDPRYGVLPGAVLISAGKTAAPKTLKTQANDDGSVLVSGYRTRTGTQQNAGQDQRFTFTLEPKATVDKKSEVLVTSGNQYQRDKAEKSGSPLALPGDAGRIALQSERSFDWAARFNLSGKAADKLSAGQFDLSMPDMVVQADVTESLPEGMDNAMRVSMSQLNALGADSVLLGGVRTTQTDGSISIQRTASRVVFQADTAKGEPRNDERNRLTTTGELLAVAKDSVEVERGLTLTSTGQDTGAARRYVLEGDGAALQVGNLADTDIRAASGLTGQRGDLLVGMTGDSGQTTLKGHSVQLDATRKLAVSDETVRVDVLTLSLGGERLAVGALPEGQTALANTVEVTGNLLAATSKAQRLKLRAYTSIDLRGNAALGSEQLTLLTLDAPQLRGLGDATDVATMTAQNIRLANSSGLEPAQPESGKGTTSLQVIARPVLKDGQTGGVTMASSGSVGQRLSFASTTLDSTGDIVMDGSGRTRADGDLTLRAARVTATSSADQTLDAAGILRVQRAVGGQSLNESVGVAGRVSLQGQRVEQSGLIDMESGRLEVLGRGATGRTDTVVFSEGSQTRVDGRLRKVTDTFSVASSGGSLSAQAAKGQIVVDGLLSAAAPVLPAGVSGDNPYAGKVSLTATGEGGEVVLGQQARINLDAAQGHGGTLTVDTRQLSLNEAARQAATASSQAAQTGLDKLLAASANTSGNAHREVSIRVRDKDLALDTSVHAAKVIITADGGKLDLGIHALVNATVPQGGVVQLQARDDLHVQDGASILAQSTREGAQGGDVLLSSTKGHVKLGQASILADSTDDSLDGRIVLRASQSLDSLNMPTGDVQVALAGSGAPVLQAGQIDIEGVRTYSDAPDADPSTWHTGLNAGTSTDQTWGLDNLRDDAQAFASLDNQSAIASKLGLQGRPQVHVKAGIEVQAQGPFDVGTGDDINLNTLRAGGEAVNVTVRAAGNLQVNSNLSDGFSTATTTGVVQAGGASSLRLVAGADLDSANLHAVKDQADTGHFTLASGKVLRTTTGSLDVHASGDVRLMAQSTSTPSAMYVAGGLSVLPATERFTTTASATTAYAKAVFTDRGGRLTVSAGGELGSFASVTDSAETGTTRVAQMLTQLSGNYFYHGGNPNATLALQRLPVAWWTGINQFRQGLGSFGGGNVDVSAGGSVSNVAVVAPTNARQVVTSDGQGGTASVGLKVLGGGDITVTAGQDIVGGAYFLGRGEGRLLAEGSIVTGADQVGNSSALPVLSQLYKPAATLALMSGSWSVDAVEDINLGHVYNPTLLPFATGATSASGLNTNTQAALYQTYDADSAVSMRTLKGDLAWMPDDQNLKVIHNSLSPVEKVSMDNATLLARLAPAVVHVTSLEGDVTLPSAGRAIKSGASGVGATNGLGSFLFVAPSAQSDVNVHAGRDLHLQGSVQMLDQSQVALPSTSNPGLISNATTGMKSLNDALFKWGKMSGRDALVADPVSDSGQSSSDHLVRFHAGRDVIFDQKSSEQLSVSYNLLRSNRAIEVVAGRDVIRPQVVAQHFNPSDTSKVVAGRDVVGNDYTPGPEQVASLIAAGGAGALKVEAGRDIRLNRATGVLGLGNQLNTTLPAESVKITLSAGNARTVNLEQVVRAYGADPALRSSLNQALQDSGLPVPGGRSLWSDLSTQDALAAFSMLKPDRQVQALNRYLNAAFVARYLPAQAGRDDAYYRSEPYLRLKQEAMWKHIIDLAGQAVDIAVSSDAQLEAQRKIQRAALYVEAAQVADLAGFGVSFDRVGDVDLSLAKVHNEGQGGGSVPGQVDDSLGGIDVIAAGQVSAGQASSPSSPNGFINFRGGSFRSLSSGDFLAGDQKVIVIGRGGLTIYTTDGSIDSGKGSNTAVAKPLPRRVFDPTSGTVVTLGNPPTSGSGFQTVEAPADLPDGTPVNLFAPNGEIRALDAFIKGGQVNLGANVVKGADNIANANGGVAPPPPTVALNVNAQLPGAQSGAAKAAEASGSKPEERRNSQLSVELLGFGGAVPAAGNPSGDPEPTSDQEESKRREEETRRRK